MKLYSLIIRRDANTMTPVAVPEHEIALLQTVHGEENIQTVEGRVVDLAKLGEADVAGEIAETEDEFARLASKYGADEKGELFVEQVYGKKATKGLEKAMAEVAKKTAKK